MFLIASTGATYLLAVVLLLVSRAALGSPLFFLGCGLAWIAYALVLARIWRGAPTDRRVLLVAFGLAVAFRLPLALSPVGADNDMIRYLWDGRVQRLGYNPYVVIPADPALVHTHTTETLNMPSKRARTPYPPAAQLFFRLVVTVHDSALAMKLAVLVCDLLTGLVLWRWLRVTGRNEWLALAYAWHPLVVLEVSHSGHIDALGALWIVASAYWLAARRRMLASIAFALAIGTKLLPVVLAPLYLGRIRIRDGVVAGGLLAALYFHFMAGESLPLGALPNVVANIRFNGPVFLAFSFLSSPAIAAALAVLSGLAAAAFARWKLSASDPAGWSWPMALSLAGAPVVYPWYLLYLTPFLFTRATLPLITWSCSASLAYLVWYVSRQGARWMVPVWVLILEYGAVVVATFVLARSAAGRSLPATPSVERT